eukprot:m.244621 g.244621  ORF g.244621 m.244621 type:complete len:108 (+) comp16105_c0_seq24:1400-1723(+)
MVCEACRISGIRKLASPGNYAPCRQGKKPASKIPYDEIFDASTSSPRDSAKVSQAPHDFEVMDQFLNLMHFSTSPRKRLYQAPDGILLKNVLNLCPSGVHVLIIDMI